MSSIFNNTNDDNNNYHNNNNNNFNNNDNNYSNDNGYDVLFNTFITTCIHERLLVQQKSPSLHVRSLEWFIKHELCVLTPGCWCLTEMVGWSCRVFTSRVCQVVHTSYEDRGNKEYIPGSAWSLIWWSTKLSKCWHEGYPCHPGRADSEWVGPLPSSALQPLSMRSKVKANSQVPWKYLNFFKYEGDPVK